MRGGTDNSKAQKRSLLQKVQRVGVPLRSIDDGRPFDLLRLALTEAIPPHRLVAIEPPTFGYGSVEAFFDIASPVLGPVDRWVLPILASEVMDFFWGEIMGGRPLAESSHEVFNLLGNLPIKVPHQDFQDWLGNMVQLIRASIDDEPMVLELKTDLDGRVYSVYGLNCSEIDLVEGGPDET